MQVVNVHEAKTHLSRLLNRISAGEEIVIAKSGKPVARLVPYSDRTTPRVPGKDRGLFSVPEDFDAPLPEELLREFDS
jgi:prevent-host-death family protein